MKLRNKFFFSHGSPTTVSVHEAVRATLSPHGSGQVELAADAAERAGDLLASLVDELHAAKLLSDEQVLRLLPSYEAAE